MAIAPDVHEREALLITTSSLPSYRSKLLKFVERPDYTQILKAMLLAMRSVAVYGLS